MNGRDLACENKTDGGKSFSETEEDNFYEKLSKLNESSCLGLVFNFRQTNIDLFKFYEQVTKRGGYHQVTKDRKWGEVASSLNPESSPLLQDQLQKIYESLLSPFEQIYHYRSTPKVAAMSRTCFGAEQLLSGKKNCPFRPVLLSSKEPSSGVTGSGLVEKRLTRFSSAGIKEEKKVPEASVKPRSAYQLFISKECERIREIDKESSERHIRGLAIDAWRRLPEKKRKPYVDESNEERKRLSQQLKTKGTIIKSISERF